MVDGACSVEDIKFIGGGHRSLVGRVVRPPRAEHFLNGVLFVHGLHSSQQGYARRADIVARSLNCVCLTFDLSGHGRSSGDLWDLTPLDHLADLAAAHHELRRHTDTENDRIGVCAASYGAYLAAFLVSTQPVCRLLLRAPALYPDSLLRTAWAHPRSSRSDAVAPKLADALRRYPGDVFILESECDEVIPHAVIDWYINARPNARHKILRGAGHAIAGEDQEHAFIEHIVSFFKGM